MAHTGDIAKTGIEILTKLGYSVSGSRLWEYEPANIEIVSYEVQDRITDHWHKDILSSLQLVVRHIVAKKLNVSESEVSTLIDINSYWEKKISDLELLAKTYAERAKTFNTKITCDPMTALERKILHSVLQKFPNIYTESYGEGKDRHIVIEYIKTDELA